MHIFKSVSISIFLSICVCVCAQNHYKHLYLILQLLNPSPQQCIFPLCVPQPLLDILIGCNQGEVRGDRLVTGAH